MVVGIGNVGEIGEVGREGGFWGGRVVGREGGTVETLEKTEAG